VLRGSRLNPNLSAWAQAWGSYDCDRTPIAPPGTRVVAHVKPDARQSWDPHGEEGCCIGPALQHCRNCRVWVIESQSMRTSDTLAWFPHNKCMPTATSLNIMQAALTDILHAIKNPHRGSVFPTVADNQRHVLQRLDDLFHDQDPCEPATQPLSPSAQVVAPPPRVNDDAPVPRVDEHPVTTASDTTTPQSASSPRVIVNDNTDTPQRTRKVTFANDTKPPAPTEPASRVNSTLAHHFLHVRAKTSGTSSCLSEPPEGVGPAPASRMTSGG
jgi:hypothetical protein